MSCTVWVPLGLCKSMKYNFYLMYQCSEINCLKINNNLKVPLFLLFWWPLWKYLIILTYFLVKEIFITDLHHSFLVAIFTGKALRPEWGQQAELVVFSSCLPFSVGQAKGRATLSYTRVLLKLVCSEQKVEVGGLWRSLQLMWSFDSCFVFMKHPSFPRPTGFLSFFEKCVWKNN